MRTHTPWLAAAATILVPASLGQGAADLFESSGAVLWGDQSQIEVVADVDGDGELELFGWWMIDDRFRWMRVEIQDRDVATGTWSTTSALHHTEHEPGVGDIVPLAGDVDADGRDEVILVNKYWYSQPGWPTGWSVRIETYGTNLQGEPIQIGWTYTGFVQNEELAAAIADFDQDGYSDVVVYTGEELILRRSNPPGWIGNTNTPKFVEVLTLPGYGGRGELIARDVVGDSTPDILFLQDHGAPVLWVMEMSGTSLVSANRHVLEATAGGQIITMDVGDIDGDGDLDVAAFGHDGRVQIVRSTPTGFEVEPRTIGGPATKLADVDGDGDLDGICCGGGGPGPNPVQNTALSTFHVCTNDGTGAFDVAVAFGGLGARHVTTALDFDSDGDLDVIAGRAVLFGRSSVGSSSCDGTPNSSGSPATMAASGRHSMADGGPELSASGLPPSTTCVLLSNVATATNTTHQPFWDGNLCVSPNGIQRLGIAAATPSGQVQFGRPMAANGSNAIAGLHHSFQVWFRDVTSGGTGANTSNAIRIWLND